MRLPISTDSSAVTAMSGPAFVRFLFPAMPFKSDGFTAAVWRWGVPRTAPAGVVLEIYGEGVRPEPGSKTDLSDVTVSNLVKSTYLATLGDCFAEPARVTIHFAVGSSGTTVMDPKPDACVTKAVEAWKFPVPIATEYFEDGIDTPGQPASAYFSVEIVAKSAAPEPPRRAADAPPATLGPPADATKLPSGVWFKVVQAGPGGPKPTPDDSVRVRYMAWTAGGQPLDRRSARDSWRMTSFRGLADGLAQMSVGDHYQIWVPERLTSDMTQTPDTMTFYDVELVEIVRAGSGGR